MRQLLVSERAPMALHRARWIPGRAQRNQPGDSEVRLRAALHESVCPICSVGFGADTQWLKFFLHEGYHANEALARVTRAPGFCSRHGALLATYSVDSGAIAWIHAATLARLLDEADHSASVRRSWALRPTRYHRAPTRPTCGACERVSSDAERNAYFLALVLQRPDAGRYGSPGLVCMPHLALLSKFSDPKTLKQLLAVHADRLNDLVHRAADGTHADGDASRRSAAPESGLGLERAIATVIGERVPSIGEGSIASIDPLASIGDPCKRLRARLSSDGVCAICAEMAEVQRQWLHWLSENAAGTQSIEDALPSCPAHVWLAFRAGVPALRVRLARRVLEQAQERIKHARHWGLKSRPNDLSYAGLIATWAARRSAVNEARAILNQAPRCALCDSLHALSQQTLCLLGTLLAETATQQAFETGSGICARHAVQARSLLDSIEAERLAKHMRVKLSAMRWQLREMLRRTAWDTRPEPRGEELSAWRRAIWVVSGHMT